MCLSVRPANKKAYSSFIIGSRKVIRISGERAYNPLQDNEAVFSKNIFKHFRPNFQKITYLHKNACFSFIINSRIIIRISDERVWHSLQENEAIFSKNIYIFQFSTEFSKNYVLAYYFCVISGRKIFYISGERD